MVSRSLSNKNGKRHVEVDAQTQGLVTVDGQQRLVHAGEYFNYNFRGTILTVASQFVTILTGTKKLHLRVFASCELGPAGCAATLYEDPTLATDPDQVAVNKNRNSSNAALARFDFDIVPSPLGTAIGFDNVSGTTGGEGRMKVFGEADWILKPNTYYSVQLFNNNAGTNLVNINLEFSEEQP
jgi:hypothetical protein